ncbi:MAG: hypothetical protein JXB04_00185 [Kiritimatiellae bacterium]|nr:hypothetical protein [Kiritimatiellia bacterium]
MKPVSFASMVFVPMVASLGAVMACWLYYGLRRGTARRDASGERIYRCTVCRHVYVDDRDVPLARCPRCGCLNEAVKR